MPSSGDDEGCLTSRQVPAVAPTAIAITPKEAGTKEWKGYDHLQSEHEMHRTRRVGFAPASVRGHNTSCRPQIARRASWKHASWSSDYGSSARSSSCHRLSVQSSSCCIYGSRKNNYPIRFAAKPVCSWNRCLGGRNACCSSMNRSLPRCHASRTLPSSYW